MKMYVKEREYSGFGEGYCYILMVIFVFFMCFIVELKDEIWFEVWLNLCNSDYVNYRVRFIL